MYVLDSGEGSFWSDYFSTYMFDIIRLLHAGEGNMKIYSPKSIIYLEGNPRGEYDTRG
jgi:hypothetical protein